MFRGARFCGLPSARPSIMRSIARRLLLGCALLASCAAQAQLAVGDFDSHFDAIHRRYALPGLAVGVVQGDRVIYTRTAGVLASGSEQKINNDTIFKIASNTKAMTAALLARLVDAGKLKWDDPVTKYLQQFRMHDPWVTRELQVRDLLIHNSGFGAGAGDLMLWPEPNLFTRDDVLRGLGYLKPKYSFRSRYAYDNTLYIVAGEVAAAAGGAPYDVLVRREIFEPLGMKRCQVGEWRRDAVGNVAQPHMRRGERNVVIRADGEVIPDIPMAAAGGIRCSLDDMLAWIRMWLDPERSGLVDGKPWLSKAQRDAVWTAHMPMPLTPRMRDWDGSHFSAYGYGWRLTDVDGTSKVSHTGTLAGMYSAVVLLPEKNAGFVILINGDADEARTVLTQVLVKHFTAPGGKHTVAKYADLLAKERQDKAEKDDPVMAARARLATTPGELDGQLGRYRDPWFGEVAICAQGQGVRFAAAKSPKLTGRVMRANGRLLVDWDDADVDAEAWLDFAGEAPNAPATLAMSKVDPEADFSYDYEDLAFSRVGACAAH
jgi:CubicO group peptidase (beta-lactamase class C family)